MKKLTSIILSAVYALSTLLSLSALVPVAVRAHEGHDHGTVAAATTNTAAQKKEATYKYVAQQGDSYSKMARKAIQTYGIKNKVKISPAKIIAAETWLTKDAGSPLLSQGQTVELKEASVKAAADKAVKLTKAQEAKWNVYATGVNFNTDAVGESK